MTTMSIINPYSKKRPRQDSNTEGSRFPEMRGQNFESTCSSLIQTKSSSSAIHRKRNEDPPLHNDVSALVISASNKAGMEGIDRTRIDAIILRESGDSLFMQQQRKRDDRVNQRIQQMKQKLQHYQDSTGSDAIPATNREMEEQLASYRRPSRSTAVVVDMDMFYMACELLTRPELHHKPACVGGGMISTSNYCARKYGVRSAMPGFIGDKLVEELSGGKEKLVHVDHHFSLYKEKSKQVLEVLAEFDPVSLRAYSLDEAFMELGPYLAVSLQHPAWSHEHIRQFLSPKERSKDLREQEQESDAGTGEQTSLCPGAVQNDATIADPNEQEQQTEDNPQPVTPLSHYRDGFAEILETYPCSVCLETAGQIVADLRHRVTLRTGGLTCSAGLAPNFMIAKIASDQNKPNGQCIVDPAQLLEFIHPMSTRKIPGIGRVTAKLLQAFGVSTVQDLYERRGLVHFLFKPITARSLLRASVGCDSSSSCNDNNNNNHSDDDEDPTTGSASTLSKREPRKGMSRERTFSAESSWAQLNARLEDIARLLSKDMYEKQVVSHTITVKVKLQNFDVLSKCRSMARDVYVQAPEELIPVATELLKQVKDEYIKKQKETAKQHQQEGSEARTIPTSAGGYPTSFACRLLGIRCSNLVPADMSPTTSADLSASCSGSQLFMEQFLPNAAVHDKWGIHNHSSRAAPENSVESTGRSASSSHAARRRQPRQAEAACPAEVTPEEHADGFVTASGVAGRKTQAKAGQEPVFDQTMSPTRKTIGTKFQCPLCHQPISAHDNDALNRHIDSCLSASTVRQAVRESSFLAPREVNSTKESSKKRRLVDFWNKHGHND